MSDVLGSTKITEQELRQFADNFYNNHFIDLIAEFVNKLDALQEENEILKSRFEFVSMISHQLRTPITVIKWSLELINEKLVNTDKEVKGLTDDLYEKVEDMRSLIDSLLYFIEIGGKYKIENQENLSIFEIIQANLSYLNRKIALKKISIEFKKPNFNDLVFVDKKAIGRSIYYLLDNAITYNKNGGFVKINIQQLDGFLKINIKDSGFGIPKDEQGNIFKKFFRATNASLGKNEGSGISLYMSKLIIEQHGGKIGFTSEEDKGSIFWLEIPIHAL